MQRLLIIAWVWLGFAAAPPAHAKAVARPTAVLAKLTLGAPAGLDGIRAFADALQPGISPFLEASMLLRGGLGVAPEGLDLTGPVHVLYLDTGTDRGVVAFARVADAAQLPAGSHTRKGWALVGAAPLVKLAAAWAHATLTSRVPPDLVGTAYPDAVLQRRASELQAARTSVVAQRGTLTGDALAALFDGLVGAATDTVAVTMRIDASADRLAATVSLAPRTRSALAAFVQAQQPSDFLLLDRLAAGPAPYLAGMRIALGPYRASAIRLATAMFAAIAQPAQAQALDQLLAALTGETALAMTIDVTAGAQMRAVYGITDPVAAETAIASIHGALATPQSLTIAGVTTTSVAVPGKTVHDGVTVRAYETTTSPAIAATAQRSDVAVTDRALVVVTDRKAPRSIDAARGIGTSLRLTASQRELFELARQRQDSVAMTIDGGALFAATPIPTGLSLPAGSDFFVSLGFARRAVELHVAVPAGVIRALMLGARGATP